MAYLELLDKGTSRIKGVQVRQFNILAAKMLKELVGSTFCPLGKEKIYIDIIGEATLHQRWCNIPAQD